VGGGGEEVGSALRGDVAGQQALGLVEMADKDGVLHDGSSYLTHRPH
jgi:hypothetical protein